jgi:hypothetical protein
MEGVMVGKRDAPTNRERAKEVVNVDRDGLGSVEAPTIRDDEIHY